MTSENDGRLVYTTINSRGHVGEPVRVAQASEPLNKEQRELAHQMSCTRAGCLRCGE